MLRSVLVGLDGSPYSASAIELGIQWAKWCDALLVGIGVIDEPTITLPELIPVGGVAFKAPRDHNLIADARHKVEQFLETFTLRCIDERVPHKLLEDVGVPAERILLEAQRYDLLLLGQQTFYHFETQHRADHTINAVLKNSPRPVVAVPETLKPGTDIVVAYDGSVAAARTLQAFQSMGLDEGEDVHVVTVHSDRVEAARCAERAVEFLRFHEINAQAHPIASSLPPAAPIMDFVKQCPTGLLVMGAYAKPTWKELFYGSVTRAALDACPVPIFLYH